LSVRSRVYFSSRVRRLTIGTYKVRGTERWKKRAGGGRRYRKGRRKEGREEKREGGEWREEH
jgi:hypothetical protein